MQRKTKKTLKKIFKAMFFITMLFGIILTNAMKLQERDFSNYERTTDEGISDYYDDPVTPVIAALFYESKPTQSGFVQRGEQKKETAKMAVIPKDVSSFNRPVIDKLYDEIPINDRIRKLTLIYNDTKSMKVHANIINRKFNSAKINRIQVDNEHVLNIEDIEKNLSAKGELVIFLANLDRGLNSEKSERLANEAVFFAQKNNYHMNVFDIVDDDYVALALESGEKFVYENKEKGTKASLIIQKVHLDRFVYQNQNEILRYFLLNMQRAAQGETNIEIPDKTEKNYRLFDRGSVYINVQDEDDVQIFEELKVNQEESIIAIISKAAMHIANSDYDVQGKYFHIYLLTEMEQISEKDILNLAKYLEPDDGIYVSHQKQAGIMLAQDRPDDTEQIIKDLRSLVKVDSNVKNKDLSLYRFKYVEILYEN